MSVEGIFYVFIYVSDFERSKQFYGEMLGFKIGTDEADVAGFAFGDAYLVIHRDTRPADKIKYGGGMWLAAKVDDVELEHARLEEAGVKVGEILDQPWGERQFYFEDPDVAGNAVRCPGNIALGDSLVIRPGEMIAPNSRQSGSDANPAVEDGESPGKPPAVTQA